MGLAASADFSNYLTYVSGDSRIRGVEPAWIKMLKSGLRIAHTVASKVIGSDTNYNRRKFVGLDLDRCKLEKSNFTGCVFADCGLRDAEFDGCMFINCVFGACYLKNTHFKDCTFRGCTFEICTTSGVVLDDCTIEYIDFFRCFFPYREIIRNLRGKHDVNDKLLLNCAAEAHAIGRWRDAEFFLAHHLAEKRLYWRRMVFSNDEFFKKYSIFDKMRAFGRLAISGTLSAVFGERPSIIRFLLIGMVLLLLVGPVSFFFADQNQSTAASVVDIFWVNRAVHFVTHYSAYLAASVSTMLGVETTVSYTPQIDNLGMFAIVSRTVAIVYVAVLGNVATSSVSYGPKW